MVVTLRNGTHHQVIAPGRERYLTHTDHLMMVVLDFEGRKMSRKPRCKSLCLLGIVAPVDMGSGLTQECNPCR